MEIQSLRSPVKPDERYIRTMFDGLARRYSIFTFLIGFGQDNRLRRKALEPLRRGMRVLDLACGTGELAILAAQKIGAQGQITGLDFSPNMIERAKERSQKLGLDQNAGLRWIVGKAEDLPLGGERFDLIVSGFALRNLYENIGNILAGVRESLAENGQIAFLDLTEPVNPVCKALYRFHLFVLVGLYGAVLFGKKYPIPYLPASASRFFKAHEFTEELKKAGFRNVGKRSFMLGAVTLYRASR